MLVNLLQCDVMLVIMQTVLKRALDLKAITFSESHVQRVSTKDSKVVFWLVLIRDFFLFL